MDWYWEFGKIWRAMCVKGFRENPVYFFYWNHIRLPFSAKPRFLLVGWKIVNGDAPTHTRCSYCAREARLCGSKGVALMVQEDGGGAIHK